MNKTVFKNIDIHNEFRKILDNKKFWLKRYWFKRVAFDRSINTSWKIQYTTGIKLLKVYKEYYETHKKVTDIFKWEKLLSNEENERKVIFTYIDDKNYSLYKVINEVLSLA